MNLHALNTGKTHLLHNLLNHEQAEELFTMKAGMAGANVFDEHLISFVTSFSLVLKSTQLFL